MLTPESCSRGLTGCASLSVTSDDLVPEARLHLSGWTSYKSALALHLLSTSPVRLVHHWSYSEA